jgi:hypothetical protein
MADITKIVADLIAIIGMTMTQPAGAAPLAPPVIQQLEPEELQARACGKKCNVLAWFGPDGVIYIDKRVDPEVNKVARGILLHELVHHVQKQQLGNNSSDCKEWLRREREAYEIQAHWLFKQGIDPTPLMWQVRTMQCHPMAFGGGQAAEGARPGS